MSKWYIILFLVTNLYCVRGGLFSDARDEANREAII